MKPRPRGIAPVGVPFAPGLRPSTSLRQFGLEDFRLGVDSSFRALSNCSSVQNLLEFLLFCYRYCDDECSKLVCHSFAAGTVLKLCRRRRRRPCRSPRRRRRSRSSDIV